MKIRTEFYAQLRDLTNKSAIEVEVAERATVADLLQQIYAMFPALKERDKTILIGAGVEFVAREYQLSDNEEIAIMPPVQGG